MATDPGAIHDSDWVATIRRRKHIDAMTHRVLCDSHEALRAALLEAEKQADEWAWRAGVAEGSLSRLAGDARAVLTASGADLAPARDALQATLDRIGDPVSLPGMEADSDV